MTTLFVTEYANALSPPGGVGGIAFPLEPPTAEQTVTIGAGSLQSAAFNNSTRFVRLRADSLCCVSFGKNPTATTGNARMPANSESIVAIPQGQAFKVAVIQIST
ncbi:MAG TPA: hypothetical protein VEU47_13465 [Candidatus Cybelea sp.]|nr:hypothetical protein [Candidatus Cybelea sp.]